jgi:3-methyladenine DNA glycosylase AlkD
VHFAVPVWRNCGICGEKYSRRLRDAGSRSVLRLAYELKNSGIVHRFFSDELIADHKGAMECLTRRDLEQIGAGMDSWDQVDSFATIVAGPAWRAGRIGDADVAKWARSRDRWWRRAALVCSTKLNVIGTNGDAHRTLSICKMLLDDYDDMIVKAMSWALRALSKRNPERTQRSSKDTGNDFIPVWCERSETNC